jgi:hypothetical protein
VDPPTPHCHHQCLPSPVPSPPVLFFPPRNAHGKGNKIKLPGGGVKSEKINVTLAYGVLGGGGEKIKGGVKLSDIYG